MYKYANPAEFQRLAARLLPWVGGATVILFALGLYYGLYASPVDYQQGHTVRIMYVHVPAAWMAMFSYVVVAGASAPSLIWTHPLADVAARAAAPIGAVFTALALITGMLWGEPLWGTWWEWDARMTSVLVLFFLYLGDIALWDAIDNPATASRAAAILALVGVINIPIIKFSVDWWNSLHQPASVLRLDGPSIHGDMLIPLFIMFAAAKLYFITVLLWRMRGELTKAKIRALESAARARAELSEETP